MPISRRVFAQALSRSVCCVGGQFWPGMLYCSHRPLWLRCYLPCAAPARSQFLVVRLLAVASVLMIPRISSFRALGSRMICVSPSLPGFCRKGLLDGRSLCQTRSSGAVLSFFPLQCLFSVRLSMSSLSSWTEIFAQNAVLAPLAREADFLKMTAAFFYAVQVAFLTRIGRCTVLCRSY